MRLSIPTTQVILISCHLAMTASAGPLAVLDTQPSLPKSPPTTTTTLAAEFASATINTAPTSLIIMNKESHLEYFMKAAKDDLETTKVDIEDWWDHPEGQ